MRRRKQGLFIAQSALLAAAVIAAVASSDAGDWRPLDLFASLLALAMVGELLSVRAGSVRIGPGFLATALAMALLGPAPAATIAVSAMLPAALRARTPPELLFNNVVNYTTYPVVGGYLIAALLGPGGTDGPDLVTALVVFAIYLPTNLLNFLLVVGYHCARDGTSLGDAFRRLYLPILPWEITTGALTSATVLAYAEVGLLAVGLLALMLVSHQFLLQAVVDAERQRDELRERFDELEGLQRGVARVLVETLSMRDKMTARHSAAVARFTRATAQAIGLSESEQEQARIAGLLHDVGKFTFPDNTLNTRELTEEDWRLIKEHPQRGADIVRRVRGYGAVADIILCHHERIDGTGYPRGLPGAQIPIISRIISIADTFDVMTARDSYRSPVSDQAAIDELRRVSGTQLDGDLVEVFVGLIEKGGMDFRHADDADFEAELTYERRVAPPRRRFLRRPPQPAASA